MRDGTGAGSRSPSGATVHDGSTPRSRGQLLVLTALVLAALFVGLAALVSSSIYAGVTATGDTGTERRAAAHAYQETVRVVADSRAHANAKHGESHDALVSNVTAMLDTQERALADEYAKTGSRYDLSTVAVTNRTAVVHDDATRAFTDASGATDWTLADDVGATRTYRMNVTREALADAGTADRFRLRIANGSTTWELALANDTGAGGIEAAVTVEGSTTTCTAVGDTAELDLIAGTLAGADCSDLAFPEFVEGPYRIGYTNGDNATGEYELDVTTGSAAPTTPYATGTASPRATFTLGSVTVEYSYRNRRVTHAANATVP